MCHKIVSLLAMFIMIMLLCSGCASKAAEETVSEESFRTASESISENVSDDDADDSEVKPEDRGNGHNRW